MEPNNQKLNNEIQLENQTMPSLEFEPNKKLVLIVIVVALVASVGMYFLKGKERDKIGNTLPAPIPINSPVESNNKNEPVWLKYEDDNVYFLYPKTFCGTSWQEEWDTISCNDEYEIIKTAGKENPNNQYIHILPPYSSFGGESGGDIVIKLVNENDFLNATQGKDLEHQVSKNNHEVLIENREDALPNGATIYYVQNKKGSYIIIYNFFPNKYPEYIQFLLDSFLIK